MNLLFVDKRIPDVETFTNSINQNTKFFLYDETTQFSEIDTFIQQFDFNFDNLCFAFSYDGFIRNQFVEQQFFITQENNFIVNNKTTDYIKKIVSKFNIKNIDFLACNLLTNSIWNSFFQFLITNFNVSVRASNDRTGNVKNGGDWILESSNTDIQNLYFNDNIRFWNFVLDSTSDHSLALMANGTVIAWGNNGYGQTTVSEEITTSNKAIAISAGGYHSLALMANGTVIAWGHNGDGRATVPNTITTSNKAIAISAGGHHSLALMANGTVIAWGYNGNGRATVPNTIATSNKAIAISAGGLHSLALMADGTVIAWGYNQVTVPAEITTSNKAIAISAGRFHSLALMANGTVIAWGHNVYEQALVPAEITTSNKAIAISAGGFHSLALMANGTVIAWGYNGNGQTTVPNTIATSNKAIAISAGGGHSLALMADGTVIAWGNNQTSIPIFTQKVINILGYNFQNTNLYINNNFVLDNFGNYIFYLNFDEYDVYLSDNSNDTTIDATLSLTPNTNGEIIDNATKQITLTRVDNKISNIAFPIWTIINFKKFEKYQTTLSLSKNLMITKKNPLINSFQFPKTILKW